MQYNFAIAEMIESSNFVVAIDRKFSVQHSNPLRGYKDYS